MSASAKNAFLVVFIPVLGLALLFIAGIQYTSLFGPYGPMVEFVEETNTVEVNVFVTAKLDQLIIEYDANAGVRAPRGCHYDTVTEKFVTLLCGTKFGLNTVRLDSNKPFWASARLSTGRHYYFPVSEFLPAE